MRYEAHVWESKKQVYLGGFLREIDAALAHDLMALWSKGPGAAPINFPAQRYAPVTRFYDHVTQQDIIDALRVYARSQGAVERAQKPAAPKALPKASARTPTKAPAKGRRSKIVGVAKAAAKAIKRPLKGLSTALPTVGFGGAGAPGARALYDARGREAVGPRSVAPALAPVDVAYSYRGAASLEAAAAVQDAYAPIYGQDRYTYARYSSADVAEEASYASYEVGPSTNHSVARADQTHFGWTQPPVAQPDFTRHASDPYAASSGSAPVAGPSFGAEVVSSLTTAAPMANPALPPTDVGGDYSNWISDETTLVPVVRGDCAGAGAPAFDASAYGAAAAANAVAASHASAQFQLSRVVGSAGEDGDDGCRPGSTPEPGLDAPPALAQATGAHAAPFAVEGRSASWSCATSRYAKLQAAAQAGELGYDRPASGASLAPAPAWGCAAPRTAEELPYASTPPMAQLPESFRVSQTSTAANDVCKAIEGLIGRSAGGADVRVGHAKTAGPSSHAASEAERFALGFGALTDATAATALENNSRSMPLPLPSMLRSGSHPRTQWGVATPQTPSLGIAGVPTTPAQLDSAQLPTTSVSPVLLDSFSLPSSASASAPWGARLAHASGPHGHEQLAKAVRPPLMATPFDSISPGAVGPAASALHASSQPAPPQMTSYGSGPAALQTLADGQGAFARAHYAFDPRAQRQPYDAANASRASNAYCYGPPAGPSSYASSHAQAQGHVAQPFAQGPEPGSGPALRGPGPPAAYPGAYTFHAGVPAVSNQLGDTGFLRLQRNSVPASSGAQQPSLEVAPRSGSFPQAIQAEHASLVNGHANGNALSFFSQPTLNEPRRKLSAQLSPASFSPEGTGQPLAQAPAPLATTQEKAGEAVPWSAIDASQCTAADADQRFDAAVLDALSLDHPAPGSAWGTSYDGICCNPPRPVGTAGPIGPVDPVGPACPACPACPAGHIAPVNAAPGQPPMDLCIRPYLRERADLCARTAEGPSTPQSARSQTHASSATPLTVSPAAPAAVGSGRCSPTQGSPSYWSIESRITISKAAGGSPSADIGGTARDAGPFSHRISSHMGPSTPEEVPRPYPTSWGYAQLADANGAIGPYVSAAANDVAW